MKSAKQRRSRPRQHPDAPTEADPTPFGKPPYRTGMERFGYVVAVILTMLFAILVGVRLAAGTREAMAPEALAPKSGQFVDTGNGRMFLQDAGPRDRTPIVLVHGTAAWSEFWRGTIDHLVERGHRVIALDLPPFGFSDRSPTGDYTRNAQARRIVGALDALKVKRAVFVGHSFGAGATIETVMLYPDRVSGLVLVAAALGLPTDGAPLAQPSRLVSGFLRTPVLPEMLFSATLTNPMLTRHLLSTMISRKEAATPELANILRRPMSRSNTTQDFVVWARGFLAPDVAAQSMLPQNFSAISAPTRLIWGTEDTLTPLAQGERLSKLIPGSRLTILPELGHIPQIEGPEIFWKALDRALSDLQLIR